MTIHRDNVPGLAPPEHYHHLTTVEARRLVFLAGQCPVAEDDSVPEGLAAQVELMVANTLRVLQAAGATPEDVVRTVVYVAGTQPELVAVWRQLTGSALAGAFTTASTLVGVTCLGYPGQLVELDVTAALA
ncbi:RidA family protein [Amycolatopsis cynarae]|uniref:RidA family protein n=1 Tax=Amycolatopsis cynarae TaxID=2995223 RepID=A0ABY7B3W9_9PSEU|nr:RidA family protein [Amycolatopsis sp. HUAS 11-8]WAL67005.1 RidA family protein [Amycolatopsis sp. HUAS 11-8]